MADLARMTGVSKITVSRAMGENSLVNARTRAKVRALAVQLGYKLNVSARNLRLRRSHTVAVVVEMTPTADRPMSHPYPLDLLGGILQELSSKSFSVLLTTRQGASLPAIQSADAVILLGQGVRLDAVRLFEQLQSPLQPFTSVRPSLHAPEHPWPGQHARWPSPPQGGETATQ